MRNRSVFPILLAASALSVACEEAPVEFEPTIGLIRDAVVGGQPVEVCQYPSTIAVNTCTGTLIHPRVVTTAAHCLSGTSASITFGAYRSGPGSFKLTGTCKTGARGSSGGGTNRDWGYCVIPEDDRVKQIPITPPIVGCEAERFLKAGASAWVVGFGTTGPSGQGAGIKRAVQVKVNRVTGGIVDVGDKDVGACHGDSGGPVYLQLTDGTHDYGLRVAGSTSSAGSARCDCTCNTLFVDIAQHVKAIEANEGIDVTPCTDAEGRWAPGPECNAIQTAPMSGAGTFPACTVPRTTEPIDSCSGGAVVPAAGSGGSGGSGGAGGRAGSAAGSGGSAGSAGRAAAGAGGMAGGAAGALAAGSGGSAAGSGGVAGAAGAGLAGSGGAAGRATGVAGNLGSSGAQGIGVVAGGPALGPAPAGGGSVVPIQPPAESGGCMAAAPGRGEGSAGLGLGLGLGLAFLVRARRRRSAA